MSLIAAALVVLVASAFIQASGNPVPVPPVAFTPKPNDQKGEGKQENARFKRMDLLLEKYLDGTTKRPGWWHNGSNAADPVVQGWKGWFAHPLFLL